MSSQTEVAAVKYSEALNRGMADAMEEDESVVLIGIDVGAGGGIFTVTRGLYDRFGPERVLDAPISEMGYVGAAVGAAMTGLRPIVEIMFMDFVGVCLDPILNQAAKLRYMTAGAFSIPVVFRTQTGAGRSAGAQHSQSLEAMFAHVPGLKVVMPSTASDAKGLLKSAIRDDNPVVFIEGETLYGTTGEVPNGDAGDHLIPIGQADIKRAGTDITLIAWSKMVWTCLDAAKQLADEGIECEVVDPRTLRPLDVETLAASVKKTGRCVIVEVGWPVAGFGAEVAYQMQRHCMDSLDAPIERVTSDDVPMPYAKNLEDEVQPQIKDVVDAVKRALYLE
jgi:pyruvate/2-oxoglutarate/acetoin dehydrogenase E1 component